MNCIHSFNKMKSFKIELPPCQLIFVSKKSHLLIFIFTSGEGVEAVL